MSASCLPFSSFPITGTQIGVLQGRPGSAHVAGAPRRLSWVPEDERPNRRFGEMRLTFPVRVPVDQRHRRRSEYLVLESFESWSHFLQQ